MSSRAALAGASALAVAGALALVLSDGSPGRAAPATDGGTAASTTQAPEQPATRPPPPARAMTARERCSTRSEADFPGGYTNPRNLVVGPLVMIAAAVPTDARTVREIGGNKFPLLVQAGHRVTVRLADDTSRFAGLAWGPLPQGQIRVRHAYEAVKFVACRPGRPTRRWRRNGPSNSYADDVNITFWSGFVLTRRPACIPLDVYVDGAEVPQRVEISLGRLCEPE